MKYNADEFRKLADEISAYITCKSSGHNDSVDAPCTCKRHGVPILNDAGFALRCSVDEAERIKMILIRREGAARATRLIAEAEMP